MASTGEEIAGPSREEILLATSRRLQAENDAATVESARLRREEHDVRQSFRRLLDPGITRGNTKETVHGALKILQTLSDNILRDPDNPKFQQFKPTNNTIKKNLVDVKGGIEYAVALGFHNKWENFQPSYIFNKRHMNNLRIGNAILKEFLDREAEEEERARRAKENEKAEKEAAAERVRLAFHDDRIGKAEADRREAVARAARAAKAAAPPPVPTPASPSQSIDPPELEDEEETVQAEQQVRKRVRRGNRSDQQFAGEGHVLGRRNDDSGPPSDDEALADA